MSLMKNRNDKIIEAAIRVFTRYGVKRTTMNDIAAEAGIVRQTLYNAFSNKDEILCATIEWYTAQLLAAYQAEATSAETLSERLDVFFRHMAIAPFELLSQSPDAGDMVHGFNEAGKEEIKRAEEAKRRALEHMLTPYEQSIAASGQSPYTLSDFVQTSLSAIKVEARDSAHLRALLSTLKTVVLSVCGTD